MFTLAAFALFACVVLPIAAWALRMTARLFGWTLRLVLGIVLAPLWIVLALVGGLAVAAQALIPIAVIFFLVSLLVPEQ